MCAAFATAGIHLPAMQVGAWAIMLCDRAEEGERLSFSRFAKEVVTGARYCERCLVTREASTESQSSSEEPKRGNDESEVLRLASVDCRAFRVIPPTHLLGLLSGRRPWLGNGLDRPAPPGPPPEFAV